MNRNQLQDGFIDEFMNEIRTRFQVGLEFRVRCRVSVPKTPLLAVDISTRVGAQIRTQLVEEFRAQHMEYLNG